MDRKSKLMGLLDDEHFGIDAIDVDTGIMINEYGDSLVYLTLTFVDRVEVYLNLYDDEAPYRNYLGKGAAESIEEAKDKAIAELTRQAYSNIH